MLAKFKVPWLNGQPDVTTEFENILGYSGAEELNHEMPDNMALLWVEANESIIEQLKQNSRLSFAEAEVL